MIGPVNTVISIYIGNPDPSSDVYVRGLSLIASVTDGQATYYHYNAHGDVVQTTTAYGAVIHDYSYDAFGVELNAAEGDTNPFRYCGEQFDSETGNYYLRARTYSPTTGRFTQEDPIRDGLNWYGYCAGNPVAFVDPSGLQDVLLRYIAEKNGAEIKVVKKSFLWFSYGLDHVEITLNGKTVTYEKNDNTVIKDAKRMIVDSDVFGADFGIDDVNKLTHQPGDTFYSEVDAAIAWGLMYNGLSIDEDKEYASLIYSVGNQFAFTTPEKGNKQSSEHAVRNDQRDTLRALIHSHGAYDPAFDSENFSPNDFGEALHWYVPTYLTTPSGRLKYYHPDWATQQVREITDLLPRASRGR